MVKRARPGRRRSALFTDTLREIAKSRARFLSILCIVGLGVAFFVGIKSAGPDMQYTADAFFDETHMHDVQILSTMGLSAADVAQIAKEPYVESVLPGMTADAQVSVGTTSLVLKLHSLAAQGSSTRMDEPVVLEGRLPQKAGECAVEQEVLRTLDLKLGDTIELEDAGDTLLMTEARIVGLVESPLYISVERGTSTLGTGQADAFCLLPAEAFDRSVYTQVNLRLRGAAALNCFSDEYEALVDRAKDALEELAETRQPARLEEVRRQAKNAIDLNQAALDKSRADADEQMLKAQETLLGSLNELASGEEELLKQTNAFRAQMDSAEKQIEQAQLQWNEGDKELSAQEEKFYNETKPAAQRQLEQSLQALDAAELALERARPLYNQFYNYLAARDFAPELDEAEVRALQELARRILREMDELPGETRELLERFADMDPEEAAQWVAEVDWEQVTEDLAEAIRLAEQALKEGRAQYRAGVAQLQAGEDQLRDARRQLDEGAVAIRESRRQLEAARREGERQLEEARAVLSGGWAQYRVGISTLLSQDAEAARRFTDAEKAIRSAYDQLDRLDEPLWYVLDRNTNYGYADYEQNTQRIAALGQVFPVLFFLVAALVSLTSMTRMVDEGRTQMGVLKALGYDEGQIASKYLLYSSFASVAGSVIGMALGFTFLPAVIYGAYSMMYTLPAVKLQFITSYALSAVLVGLLCTAGAAYLAVRKQLILTPARLMRPKMPKSGKRVLLERIPWLWRRLSFTQKVTVRNLFRYKKRFYMTVFGIAGCTALLLAGFGLRNSIMGMVGWQFGDVFHYELSVVWSTDANYAQVQNIGNALERSGRLVARTNTYTSSVSLWKDEDDKRDVTLVAAEDTDSFLKEVSLQLRGSREPLPLTDDGLILTEKMARMLGVRAGDTVWLNLGELGKDYAVPVTGITENYVYHYAYMTKAGYEKLLGQSFQANQALCSFTSTDDAFEDELSTTLMDLDGVTSVSFNTGLAEYFDDMMSSMDSVVWVIILAAGTLAFVVLYNLANINVTERERELATIKVLGFYDPEVTAYVTRENVVLTLVGTLAGLILGVFLHRYIISTVEVDLVMFGRSIRPSSFAFAAALTFVFSALVNVVMHRKLKGINMIEALKSVE